MEFFMEEHVRSIGVVDKHGDLLWMLQPRSENPSGDRLVLYLKGRLSSSRKPALILWDLPYRSP